MNVPRFKAKNPTAHEATNITAIKLITSPTDQFQFQLKYTPALNYPENYCDKSNYKQDVNDSASAVCKKSDCPGDDQDYCNDVK